MFTICATSDTHNELDKLVIPEADIFIHAGDFTNQGSVFEIVKFAKDIKAIAKKFALVLLVPGNHDKSIANESGYMNGMFDEHKNVHLLIDKPFVYKDQKFWFSPWTPEYGNWSFMLERFSPALKRKWDMIPDDTTILVTHGPPYGINDEVVRSKGVRVNVGCELLMERINKLKDLRLMCSGHIHSSAHEGSLVDNYGVIVVNGVTFANVTANIHGSKNLNPPIVFDLDDTGVRY